MKIVKNHIISRTIFSDLFRTKLFWFHKINQQFEFKKLRQFVFINQYKFFQNMIFALSRRVITCRLQYNDSLVVRRN